MTSQSGWKTSFGFGLNHLDYEKIVWSWLFFWFSTACRAYVPVWAKAPDHHANIDLSGSGLWQCLTALQWFLFCDFKVLNARGKRPTWSLLDPCHAQTHQQQPWTNDLVCQSWPSCSDSVEASKHHPDHKPRISPWTSISDMDNDAMT